MADQTDYCRPVPAALALEKSPFSTMMSVVRLVACQSRPDIDPSRVD
jgi:hypothetical protein